MGLDHVTAAPSQPVIRSMVPWTDHSAPEGWIVVPLNETELSLTSSMRAVIPVKPVTRPASKLTISPILMMACGFSCSSPFIVPSQDSVRTAAVAGGDAQQSNAKARDSIGDMTAARPNHTHPHRWGRWLQPTKLTDQRRWARAEGSVLFSSAVIGVALWRPYYAYDCGYPYSANAKS